MVKAEDSWLFQQSAAHDLPVLNCTSTLLQQGQHSILPSSTKQYPVPSDVGFAGFNPLFQCLPSLMDGLPCTLNPYFKEEPNAFCYGDIFKANPKDSSGLTGKRFVIFDQTGNHTRLFVSPLCSQPQNLIGAPTKSRYACDSLAVVQPEKMEEIIPTKPITDEKPNENQVIGERSEMHEDTEEINALLYSDDDDSDSEEDEVTSTDRSPFAINGSYKKREHMEEITVEGANLDSPSKRQRLIDGGCKKSSLMDIRSAAKVVGLCACDDYAASSCAKGRSLGEDLDYILVTKKSKKDKIRAALKIIESLIPDVKSKDPLLAIEEAINYLMHLKLKAKTLGVC